MFNKKREPVISNLEMIGLNSGEDSTLIDQGRTIQAKKNPNYLDKIKTNITNWYYQTSYSLGRIFS